MPRIALSGLFILFVLSACNPKKYDQVLLSDNFSGLDTGLFTAPIGAHTEYHYLPEAGPKGNWAVTSFASGDAWGRAWQVKSSGEGKMLCQTYLNKNQQWTHPMIIAGDSLWRNYELKVRFQPENDKEYTGVAFRYRNDRCFYFFGIKDSSVYISEFRHSDKFNVLKQTILAQEPFVYTPGKTLTAIVRADGSSIIASLDNKITLKAEDETYKTGKIGLLSNGKARYFSVEVLSNNEEISLTRSKNEAYRMESVKLIESNPKMVVWKKISTEGFGAGRNLRFGDLDGDSDIDVLIGQIQHHGPRDSHSELSCMTAMTFDGDILWQTSKPDPGKYHLTNDVGFQIHDLDNDGKNEVIYTMNFEIIVADAATGKTKYKTSLPESKIENDKFKRILGDCLFFFDAEGKGWDSNILTKDRYNNFWVFNSNLKVIWEGSCKTGHYPFAFDTDNDGCDELAIGYSLYDNDGRQLWCLDEKIGDHCDGVVVVRHSPDSTALAEIMYAASNAGYLRVSTDGQVLKNILNGHVQNPAIADFRPDRPGLETVSIDFWGSQGIIHMYDADGNIYHDFEPNQYGSMCLPLNWRGSGDEFFVLNPSVREGGVFDGHGRKVVVFPDDGHPDMCNATLDITGDCRDEIVVWDQHSIWIYTQSDNPLPGRLYKPIRNPLYNYSNYQATVSLPAWSE